MEKNAHFKFDLTPELIDPLRDCLEDVFVRLSNAYQVRKKLGLKSHKSFYSRLILLDTLIAEFDLQFDKYFSDLNNNIE